MPACGRSYGLVMIAEIASIAAKRLVAPPTPEEDTVTTRARTPT